MAVVLTNQGEDWACRCMAQTDADSGQYVHWGTGAGTAAKTDTDVFTPGSEARVAGTVSVTSIRVT